MGVAGDAKEAIRRLALKSLIVGFGLAVLFQSIAAEGTTSLWLLPVRLIVASAVLGVLALPVVVVMSFLQGRGPFGTWPEWKMFEKSEDALGLPIISWREGSIFLPPRRLWVNQAADGQWHFVFSRPRIVDASSSGLGTLLVFGMLGPLVKGLNALTQNGGTIERRPWTDLVTVEVVPWKQRHGGVGLFTHDKREHSKVLVAHFTDGRTLELSDWWWSDAALGRLTTMVAKEFIDRRGEHISKMASAARAAQSAEIGERRKVI